MELEFNHKLNLNTNNNNNNKNNKNHKNQMTTHHRRHKSMHENQNDNKKRNKNNQNNNNQQNHHKKSVNKNVSPEPPLRQRSVSHSVSSVDSYNQRNKDCNLSHNLQQSQPLLSNHFNGNIQQNHQNQHQNQQQQQQQQYFNQKNNNDQRRVYQPTNNALTWFGQTIGDTIGGCFGGCARSCIGQCGTLVIVLAFVILLLSAYIITIWQADDVRKLIDSWTELKKQDNVKILAELESRNQDMANQNLLALTPEKLKQVHSQEIFKEQLKSVEKMTLEWLDRNTEIETITQYGLFSKTVIQSKRTRVSREDVGEFQGHALQNALYDNDIDLLPTNKNGAKMEQIANAEKECLNDATCNKDSYDFL